MKYQKELDALQEYIAHFDPQEFTSSAEAVPLLVRTPEQMDHVRKLKARMQRKRQCADTFHLLVEKEVCNSQVIISQEEVDALLEGWSPTQL
jgi:hypothetical protein